MKLQNLAVIFAIIVVPMTLILSAYIGIQIDTQSLQKNYDTKLLDATHDSVVAFQLNSLNNDYSTNADSLRRDVEASINTFFTSLATNLGTPGASTSYILQYVPAVVFTLYDGYYIYSPMEVEYTTSTGAIQTKYDHTLKPYIHYSVRYKDGGYDLVVNYSLDNYITVYGYMGNTYISRSGYLIAGNVTNGGKKYSGIDITEPEAQKYYSEAKTFTDWVKTEIINGKRVIDIVIPQNAIKSDGTAYLEFVGDTKKILDVTTSNDAESEDSDFTAHKREIMRLLGLVKQQGYSLIPTSVYFNGSKVKVELALAKGKKLYDKREDAAKRDAKRNIDRTIKEHNKF